MTSRTWTSILTALGAVLLLQPLAGAQDRAFNDIGGVLGGSSTELVFTPVVPCRIVDTRLEGGRLAAGVARDFDVAGALGGQGGTPNCLVPDGPATAVAINLVAVNPLGAGNLRAWAFGAGAPTASVLNYTPAVTIANGVVIAICDQAAGSCAKDLTVRADGSDTHLVADVMGYFSTPPAGAPVSWAAVTDKPAGFADNIDNDTTYTGTNGIIVTGTTIAPDYAFVQRRVTGTCPGGSSIRTVDAAGGVTCEPDNDSGGDITSVLPGTGLSGGGSSGAVSLSVNSAAVQSRVTGTCESGIATINQNGTVACGPHLQSGRALTVPLCNAEITVTFPDAFPATPSVVVSPQGLAGTSLPPNTYCVVDEVSTTSFNFCCVGHEPEAVSWIASRQ